MTRRGRGGSSQLTRQNIARLNASTGDRTSTVISPNGSVITTISRPSLRRRRRNSVASQRNLSPGSGITVMSNGNPRGLNMNIQKIIAAMQGKVFDPDSFPQTANILQRRRGAGMNTDFRPTPSISNMSMHERFAAVIPAVLNYDWFAAQLDLSSPTERSHFNLVAEGLMYTLSVVQGDSEHLFTLVSKLLSTLQCRESHRDEFSTKERIRTRVVQLHSPQHTGRLDELFHRLQLGMTWDLLRLLRSPRRYSHSTGDRTIKV
uniref:Uncharacterized protein n=1 Tax=Timema genevievae TaxID=629358 RepID=A0A7R9PII3_TIMGE|nr:unnamed protein product [Timema genevievae]